MILEFVFESYGFCLSDQAISWVIHDQEVLKIELTNLMESGKVASF
jgi:hypothetical protein